MSLQTAATGSGAEWGRALERGLQTVQGASWTGGQPHRVLQHQTGPGTVFKQRGDVVHGIVVLVGRGRERWRVGQSGQGWGNDGVSFGGGVVLVLVFIDHGNLSVKVLDVKLRVVHEVVDGAARLGCLQTIGRHAVPEGVHHTDLQDKRGKPFTFS